MTTKHDKEVAKLMENLGVTREEAMEVIAFDKGDIGNDAVDAIEGKIDEVNQEKKRSPIEKVKYSKAKKKADAAKEAIIKTIFDSIRWNSLVRAPEVMTSTKITFQDADGDFYTVAVTKHKSKPDGYSGKEKVETPIAEV